MYPVPQHRGPCSWVGGGRKPEGLSPRMGNQEGQLDTGGKRLWLEGRGDVQANIEGGLP